MANPISNAYPTPQPHQWTLRFKNHKLTIILLIEQQQSFTSIKSELLRALKDRGISEIGGQTLPSDPDMVALAIPVDKNDTGKGWINIDVPTSKRNKSDGKATVGAHQSVLNGSPQGAGLKDGVMLAFKFSNQETNDLLDEEWDVVIPSYEEDR